MTANLRAYVRHWIHFWETQNKVLPKTYCPLLLIQIDSLQYNGRSFKPLKEWITFDCYVQYSFCMQKVFLRKRYYFFIVNGSIALYSFFIHLWYKVSVASWKSLSVTKTAIQVRFRPNFIWCLYSCLLFIIRFFAFPCF